MKREPLKALVNVASLLKEPVGSSQSYDIKGILGDEIEGSIEGTAKMIRITRGILVQCELSAEVKLICSRCLEAFLCPISFTAEDEFVPVADVSDDSALPSPEQLEPFTIDDRNILDLGELIRQYVLLNLPMKPLCRPDCQGIS
ncbi:MAG: DUF177 domain-containing protein [Dehalococcoidia bacterium]|nr:DUF177 domain-containing protein [Dehalococcoidia bacterium]MDH4291911.1 DUF177 domain-containing protein [Dehalococcoidia bacterium]